MSIFNEVTPQCSGSNTKAKEMISNMSVCYPMILGAILMIWGIFIGNELNNYIQTWHWLWRNGFIITLITIAWGISEWLKEEDFTTFVESLKFVIPFILVASCLLSLLGWWVFFAIIILGAIPYLMENIFIRNDFVPIRAYIAAYIGADENFRGSLMHA